MSKNLEQIYSELYTIIQEGNEEKAINYLLDNFNDLPETVQREVATIFFEQALDSSLAIYELEKESIDVFEKLDILKRKIEDKLQEIKLREKLNKD